MAKNKDKLRKNDLALLYANVNTLNSEADKRQYYILATEITALNQFLVSVHPNDENQEILKNLALMLALFASIYSAKSKLKQEKLIDNAFLNDKKAFSPDTVQYFKLGGFGVGLLLVGSIITLMMFISIPVLWVGLAFTIAGTIAALIMNVGKTYNDYMHQKSVDLCKDNEYLKKVEGDTQKIITNLKTNNIQNEIPKFDISAEDKTAAVYKQLFDAIDDNQLENLQPEVKVEASWISKFCC